MAWGIIVKDSDGDIVIDNASLVARLMYVGPAEGPYYDANAYYSNIYLGGSNYYIGTTQYCNGNGGDDILYLDGVSGYGFNMTSSMVLVQIDHIKGNLETGNYLSRGSTNSPLNFKQMLVQNWDFNNTHLSTVCEFGNPVSQGNSAWNSLDYEWYETRQPIKPIVVHFG